MWCKHCQQDVPAIASASDQKPRCPRCGQQLAAADPRAGAGADGSQAAGADLPAGPPPYDGWELDEQLRHVERLLGAGSKGRRSRGGRHQGLARLDPPHAGPAARHLRKTPSSPQPATSETPRASSPLGGLAWTALSLGTMTLACGGILLGWSVLGGRDELWTLGMPLAVTGQLALLVGLIVQLDRLWQDSRQAAVKLDDVDAQLHQLKTATTMLGTSHSSPASAFYCHLAEGARPELLLTDLKGQLDLLALKLGEQER